MAKTHRKSLNRRLTAAELLQEAVSFHQSGEIEKARYRYSKVLQAEPKNATAMNFYGMLESQQGDIKLAEKLLKRSVSLDPQYSDAINNLGNCLKIQGKLDEARLAYQQAHDCTPDNINPIINLGVLTRHSKEFSQAHELFQKALALDSSNILALTSLAGLHEAQGDYDEALVSYEKAVEIDSTSASVLVKYTNLLTRLDRKNEALNIYQKQLQNDPENANAQHMISALSGHNTPERASNDYVSSLFDRFAVSFDQVLEKLDYKAPSLVGDLVSEFFPDTINTLNVLDAGCGTGLCGEFLRPVARNIIGIDLSAEMLRRAEFCEHYDSLERAEIVEYLVNAKNRFDLIVSADTFCYFGEMGEVCHAAFAVINNNGRFIFTVERHEHDESDYILQSHGRYSHTIEYIESCLRQAGFKILANRAVALRKERGEPVHGMLICAAKP